MATTKQNKQQAYIVNIPFMWRGHWTKKDQELQLFQCEAQALLINHKISMKNGSK